MTSSTQWPLARAVVGLFSTAVLWLGPQVRAGEAEILRDTWSAPRIVAQLPVPWQEAVFVYAVGINTSGRPNLDASKSSPDADKDFRLSPRLDRFFPLGESFGYGESGSYDMTIWLPAGGDRRSSGPRLRLWMKTGATQPEIEFSGRKRHKPEGKSPKDPGWVDFGIVDRTDEEFGNGFACMRVFGLTAAEARISYVVFTPQTEVPLWGSIRDAERALCGMARDEVGRTFITPSHVPVKTPTEFTLCYETGPRGLPAGSLLRLAFAKAFSTPQNQNAEGLGWLEVSKARSPVEFVAVQGSIESHERNDVFFRLPKGLAAQERIYFRYKTDFMYLFSHTWSEVDRRYWWSELPPMALAVAVDDRQSFLPPLPGNGHALAVVAGPPERLHLFLPGRVRQEAYHGLNGIFTDRYRNVPSPGPIDGNIHLRLCGKTTHELGSTEGHFDRWYRFSLPLPSLPPGVYRAQAYDPKTGAVHAESNPMEILASDDQRPPIYWGQIHCHSEQSDGTGRFEDIYHNSRDEGCLDFAAGSDHAEYFSDNEWLWMQDLSNRLNEEGRFVTLNGYERAGDQGHWNFYTWADRLELFRGMNMDPNKNTLQLACERLSHRTDVVAGPHVHHGRFSSEYKSSVQCFHELYSMWGNYEKLTYDILNSGAVIGVTGGGDNHEARGGFSCEDPEGQGITPHTFAPGLKWKTGLTAALMPRLGRKELVRALRERQTYATTGPRILVDFSVSGVPMGGECQVGRNAPTIVAVVHGVSKVARVEIIRDGQTVQSIEGDGRDTTVQWLDSAVTPGRHWYLLKVIQMDQEMAWTSPIWVDRVGIGSRRDSSGE
jgi:hypothetical protein